MKIFSMPIPLETKNTTEQKCCCLMKPGDIIAFSGKNLGAKLIRWGTNSPYSHLAIVLDTKREEGGRVSIAESTIQRCQISATKNAAQACKFIG